MAINPTDLSQPGAAHVPSYWAATAGPEVEGVEPVSSDLDVDVALLAAIDFNGRLTVLDVPDGDDFDSYDAEPRRIDQAGLVMHAAAVRLEDALFAARGWLQQVQGGAPTVQAQLHALLVAAHAAGQDVLIYHNVI